jgi:hypothetical protein
VLADIDSYTTIVVHLDDATLQGLRTAGGQATTGANDLDDLTKLNDDYIQSVQHSNVKRFEEILSDDFLCSNPDGTLVDRKAFLQQTAKPVTIRNPRGARRQRQADGRFRRHSRANQLHYRRRRRKRRPLHRRLARRNGKWVAVSAHVTRK